MGGGQVSSWSNIAVHALTGSESDGSITASIRAVVQIYTFFMIRVKHSVFVLLGIIAVLVGCGGSTKATNSVDMTVAPKVATIHVLSSIDFLASGSSLVKYTNVYWVVEEEDLSCTTESVPPQAPSPCPSGWVWETTGSGNVPRTQATYYSSSTLGVYHVVAKAETLSGKTGQSVSTITVIP